MGDAKTTAATQYVDVSRAPLIGGIAVGLWRDHAIKCPFVSGLRLALVSMAVRVDTGPARPLTLKGLKTVIDQFHFRVHNAEQGNRVRSECLKCKPKRLAVS